MVSNEFWVCGCAIHNLHVVEEMRCQMCGVWSDSQSTRHVYVDDLCNMLRLYTDDGAWVYRLSDELEAARTELSRTKSALEAVKRYSGLLSGELDS
jgi:hypothetical protein